MVRKALFFCLLASTLCSQQKEFKELKMIPEKYSIQANFYYMQRNKPTLQVLTYDSGTKQSTYNTEEIKFDDRLGIEGTFTKTLRNLQDIRFQYIEVRFDKTVHKSSAAPIQFSRWIRATVRESEYRFQSDFQNARMQFHHQFSPNFLVIIGLDYVYIPEKFKLNQTFFTGSELIYEIKTQNSLVGPDFGFRFLAFPNSLASIEWLAQMGFYGNFSKQISRASLSSDPTGGNLPGFPRSTLSESGSNFSIMGRSDLSLVIKPVDWLYFYMGYSAQVVTGLALAEQQFIERELFPFPGSSGGEGLVSKDRILRSRGRMFYQGLYAGLQLRW